MEVQPENLQRRQSTANANGNEEKSPAGGVTLSAPGYQLASGGAGAPNGAKQNTQAQTGQESVAEVATAETWDSHTNRRIGGIHPAIQANATSFINRAESELGIKLRVTSGMRSYSEQDELYQQGRTTPGGKVTNARGGYSYHNFGLAIDVVEITAAGQANWDCDWNAIGALGQSMGWEWGGNWTSIVDKPHFQMAFGLSTSQLRAMYNAQGGNFVNLEGQAVPEVEAPGKEGSEQTPTGGETTPAIPAGTTGLSGSVGKGGQNEFGDTKLIQTMLNSAGASLAVDGDCGPLTIAAIGAYQMGQFGWKDGIVDVNGKTWQALESNSASQPLVYTVKKGDNLTTIAAQFSVTVAELLTANPGITNPNAISIGQKITISPQGGDNTVAPTPGKDKPSPTTGNTTETEGTSEPEEGTSTDLIYGSEVSPEFNEKVIQIAGELGINSNYLMAAMAFETGGSFDPAQKNFAGSGATGLIQFMPRTAIGLGTTTAELAKMTAVEQLDWVKAYFLPRAGQLDTLEDLYMAILWPRAIGEPNSYILWSRGSRAYEQNSGLDSNNDGSVTKGEAAGKVRAKYDEGVADLEAAGGSVETQETVTTDAGSAGQSETGEVGSSEAVNATETETAGATSTPSSANFSITEFNSRDGVAVPQEYYANVQELMNNLEILREELDGNSIKVNSGYRSPTHNTNVGGATNSQHLYGKASDIVVSNYSPSQVHETILRLITEGKMKQGGVGRYNSFTHYDIRGHAARW